MGGGQQMSYTVMESSSHFATAGGVGGGVSAMGGMGGVLDTASVGARSQGARSAADRSGAEITEYHHYTAAAQSETVTSSQHHASAGAFGWYEEEESHK